MIDEMKLYVSDVLQKEHNTLYPHEVLIRNLDDLKKAARYDHISAKMKNNIRGIDNFIEADGLILDLDNTHSENPEDWKTLDDVTDAFPDVHMYGIPSRNYMKTKSKYNKRTNETVMYAPREKYHIYFPLSKKVTMEEFKALIYKVAGLFPYFDLAAIDAAHFIYGVSNPEGIEVEGDLTIDQFTDSVDNQEIIQSVESFIEAFGDSTEETKKAVNKFLEHFHMQKKHRDDLFDNPQQALTVTGEPSEVDYIERDNVVKRVEAWAKRNNVELGRKYEKNSINHPWAVYICVSCPWEEEHSMNGSDNEAVIIIDITGRISFLCRHDHGWMYHYQDYKKFYEDKNPTEEQKLEKASKRRALNWVRDFLMQNDIDKIDEYNVNTSSHPDATVIELSCAWTDEHAGSDSEGVARIIVEKNGAYSYICTDPACTNRKWKDFRAKIESQYDEMLKTVKESVQKEIDAKGAAADPDQEQADTMKGFLKRVQTETYKPYKTGLKWFDDLLGGGPLRKSVVLLLAAPGTGKTTLCAQIAEQMACYGKPVVYLNLEMSSDLMRAKAITGRLQKQNIRMSMKRVLQGYKWTEQERQRITEVVEEYSKSVEPYMTYITYNSGENGNPGGADNTIEGLKEYLHKLGENAKVTGKEAPVIVLDYLHLLVSKSKMDVQEIIKRALYTLETYVEKYETLAIVISATNRASNSSGKITLESGRDSSGIEYSADYQLALNYAEIEDTDISPSTELSRLQNEKPRRLVLKLLKARIDPPAKKVYLNFDAETGVFQEMKSPPVYKGQVKKVKDKSKEIKLAEPEYGVLGTRIGGKRDEERKRLHEAVAEAKEVADAAGQPVTLYALAEILDVSQRRVLNLIKEYGGFKVIRDGTVITTSEIDLSQTVEVLPDDDMDKEITVIIGGKEVTPTSFESDNIAGQMKDLPSM